MQIIVISFMRMIANQYNISDVKWQNQHYNNHSVVAGNKEALSQEKQTANQMLQSFDMIEGGCQ